MADKKPPIPKRKPMYSSKVYREFETKYPQVDWDSMTTQEKNAWIAMSLERSPSLILSTDGQEIAKGGLIKKKKKMRHGGVHTKRPQMMGGGAYKGKSHSYAAGGKVAEMKLGK